MMRGQRDKLLHYDAALHERVVGQHEAIKAVADAGAASGDVGAIGQLRDGGLAPLADGQGRTVDFASDRARCARVSAGVAARTC